MPQATDMGVYVADAHPRRPQSPTGDAVGRAISRATSPERRRRAVTEPDSADPTPRLQPAIVAAVTAGIVVGAVAGAIIRGSGMMYTNLFVAGCVLTVVALAGLGAFAAAQTRRPRPARILAWFAGITVIATVVTYWIAPPFRDANADLIHPGNATVHAAELAPSTWDGKATCRTGARDPAVFLLWMPHVRVGDRDVAVLLNLGTAATSVQADKLTIASSSPTGSADYVASPGDGLETLLVGADGMTGRLRFSATLLPNAARLNDPELDRLTGTFEWACDPTRSE
jgi:hypothetical protein